jgi:hypothetical protein
MELSRQTLAVGDVKVSGSISVAAQPDKLYAMVSDVTRMGEWSPACRACWWEAGAGPEVGAWFTGRNETPDRTWEARCQVTAAVPGRKFGWEVYEGLAYWEYNFESGDGGTRVTESWQFLPAGIAMFRERYGTEADVEFEQRRVAAKESITATLAAIKNAAEAEQQ